MSAGEWTGDAYFAKSDDTTNDSGRLSSYKDLLGKMPYAERVMMAEKILGRKMTSDEAATLNADLNRDYLMRGMKKSEGAGNAGGTDEITRVERARREEEQRGRDRRTAGDNLKTTW